MKLIAYYLPQFHVIEENEQMWGKGFTEWNNVKQGEKLYWRHYQPRVPLDKNYYDLLNPEVLRWQCQLAKKNGLYGFCFYHYWFGDRKLLEKPMEMFLKDKSCDINFCISWANESWTNIWKVGAEAKIFVEQKYLDKSEWIEHYNYLNCFFQDERYIKIDNKPIVIIYRPYLCDFMSEILDLWNDLAIENGFTGIHFISQRFEEEYRDGLLYQMFNEHILYYPYLAFKKMRRRDVSISNHIFRHCLNMSGKNLNIISYDSVWHYIIKNKVKRDEIPGIFVDWDNTSRTKERGTIVYGASPAKFKKYFKKYLKRNPERDLFFIFAWNEWGEGGYLEPDEKNRYGYLEAIKEIIEVEGDGR